MTFLATWGVYFLGLMALAVVAYQVGLLAMWCKRHWVTTLWITVGGALYSLFMTIGFRWSQ